MAYSIFLRKTKEYSIENVMIKNDKDEDTN